MISIFIVSPLFALENNVVDVLELKGQLIKEIKKPKQKDSLYSFVRQEFVNYYGIKDFSDPNHETGWYRVDNFLKWVHDNEEVLQKGIVNIVGRSPITLKDLYNQDNFDNPENYYPFWTYLGGRYIADVYSIELDFDALQFKLDCERSFASPLFGVIALCFIANEKGPDIINLGIHETTHLFPVLTVEDKFSYTAIQLSELATFYSTYNYGLPVKSEVAEKVNASGVRDMRRTMALRPDLDVLKDYNCFLVGLVLNSKLSLSDVFSFDCKTSLASLNIGRFIVSFIAMKRDKFFIIDWSRDSRSKILENFSEEEIALLTENPDKTVYLGIGKNGEHVFGRWHNGTKAAAYHSFDPINGHDYMKKVFRKYGTEVEVFYDNLYANLPQDFIDEVNTKFEVQILDVEREEGEVKFKGYDGYDIVQKYDSKIREAILKTLKEMNVPESKIPEGYI